MISKRSVSALLALIALIALGTLYQDFVFDSRLSRERADAAAIDRDLASISRMVSELRAAEAGYVATGQAPASWMTRGTEIFDQLAHALGARRTAAPNSDARARYDAAQQAIANLSDIDKRARASIAQEDRLHAADLIYIDGQQAAETALAEVTAATTFEDKAASDRLARWNLYRFSMNGLALVLVSIIALYFGRALSIVSQAPPANLAQMIRELPPPVKTGAPQTTSAGAQSPPPVAPAAVGSAAVQPPVPSPISLTTAAELCVDLARVLDGRDVPGLLERAANLLDAKGIMIWAVDTGGAILRPSVCYGYPDKVLTRLRPLQVDADNVTSLAFRSMQPQAFAGAAPTDAGALAIPLITSGGCVGVLAAEVRQGKPHPDLLPVARIVAAQFATLVAPIDDGAQKTAKG